MSMLTQPTITTRMYILRIQLSQHTEQPNFPDLPGSTMHQAMIPERIGEDSQAQVPSMRMFPILNR